MANTKIEWSNKVWNPVTGCTPISPGCAHCYAQRMSQRLAGRYGYPEAPHNFDVTLHPGRLNEPLKWRKPSMVFCVSMGDLFHEDVPDSFIEDVFWTIEEAYWHTFQILTKRPERMCDFLNRGGHSFKNVPFPNLWLGATCENQAMADERIPWLLKTPAAVRFVSIEPMLGAVDLRHTGFFNGGKPSPISWIITGAETGAGKRHMDNLWAEDIKDQCRNAKIPFFFKKDSEGRQDLNGFVYHEFPGGQE